MILISFEHLQKIFIFPKFQGCNLKIVPATPFWILKFKWAWQTQFLSNNLETLEKWIFLKGVQIILLPFFHILAGFRFRKNTLKSDVHSLRRPCTVVLYGSKGYKVTIRQTLRIIQSSRTQTQATRVWCVVGREANFFFKSPTLTACNFDANWPTETHSTPLERSQPLQQT